MQEELLKVTNLIPVSSDWLAEQITKNVYFGKAWARIEQLLERQYSAYRNQPQLVEEAIEQLRKLISNKKQLTVAPANPSGSWVDADEAAA